METAMENVEQHHSEQMHQVEKNLDEHDSDQMQQVEKNLDKHDSEQTQQVEKSSDKEDSEPTQQLETNLDKHDSEQTQHEEKKLDKEDSEHAQQLEKDLDTIRLTWNGRSPLNAVLKIRQLKEARRVKKARRCEQLALYRKKKAEQKDNKEQLSDGIGDSSTQESSNFTAPVDMKTEISSETDESQMQEPEAGRRPSRRAAREAAKKIYNTVCKYGTVVDPNDPDVTEECPSLKAVPSPRPGVPSPRSTVPKPRQKTCVRVPPPNIDLMLECHEELLSTVQAEALLQAQLQYNMVMKTLRNLRASNVRIVVAPADPVPSESSSDVTSVKSEDGSSEASKPVEEISSEKVEVQVFKSEKMEDISMDISLEAPSPAPILS